MVCLLDTKGLQLYSLSSSMPCCNCNVRCVTFNVVCLVLQLKRFLSEAVLRKEYGDNLAVK